jgi:photosystem II stability/assembly factor-like uncharacterized protein
MWVDKAFYMGSFRYVYGVHTSFYDFSDGMLTTLEPLTQGSPSVYVSTNNAQSWDSSYSTSLYVAGLFCQSSTNVYLCGDSGLVSKSTNFGGSWTTQSTGTSMSLTAIYFTSASVGYIVGVSGTVLSTTNGGSTWSSLTSGSSNNLYAIYFPTSSVGFVVGANGTILKIS